MRSIGKLTWLILGRANHARKNAGSREAPGRVANRICENGFVTGTERVGTPTIHPKPLGADHQVVISLLRGERIEFDGRAAVNAAADRINKRLCNVDDWPALRLVVRSRPLLREWEGGLSTTPINQRAVETLQRPKPLLTERSASGLLRGLGEDQPAGVHAVRKGSAAQE